jgi:hypothetical protein
MRMGASILILRFAFAETIAVRRKRQLARSHSKNWRDARKDRVLRRIEMDSRFLLEGLPYRQPQFQESSVRFPQ